MKRENVITLIALVVTIIVLLILAEVGLNYALNQNGIIQRSKERTNFLEDFNCIICKTNKNKHLIYFI